MNFHRFKLSSPQIMVLGFSAVILLGALLLMLPISSAAGIWTPFIDALFTSTTSVCVTGLVVRDTGTYWSTFGQVLILLMIQIGGLGVVTLAASFMLAAGRKIGLMQRSTMQNAISAPKLGGIVRLTRFIIRGSLTVELIGAVIMAPTFVREFGLGQGLWMTLFHSISMFCNAGIDLMGIREPYSSFTSVADNPVVSITIMLLIVIGGIGFLTWDDIITHKHRIRNYKMQSKVILATSGILILVPAISFFFLEFSQMPLRQRILCSLFQAITPRTAGANTADLNAMSEAGQMSLITLMLIGGSPGSTAGGMKTTTFAVLFACAIAVFHKRDSAQFFGRRVSHEVIATACTITFMYVGLSFASTIALSILEGLPILPCLFEAASAVATVGLSLGITPGLHTISKLIIISLMFIGRVGALTLVYATLSTPVKPGKLPLDNITVG